MRFLDNRLNDLEERISALEQRSVLTPEGADEFVIPANTTAAFETKPDYSTAILSVSSMIARAWDAGRWEDYAISCMIMGLLKSLQRAQNI